MDDDLRRSFMENLQKYMIEQGKTQSDLSAFMNISTATAAYWYNGKKMPRIDKLQKIAGWLGIDLPVLLGQSEPDILRDENTATLARRMVSDPLMIELYELRKSVSDERFRTFVKALSALVKEG